MYVAQSECLATDGIEIRKTVQYIILKVRVWRANRDELLSESFLGLRMKRERVENARKSIAGRVGTGKEEGIDLRFQLSLGKFVLGHGLVILID